MQRLSNLAIILALSFCAADVGGIRSARAAARPDIVFADFETPTYGDWKTEGTAFGDGPAEGTLPHQMPVTGYKGRRLVNSFHGGDDSIGTLTSPDFTIKRHYVAFLIGGGGFEGKTCMNLLVDDKVVRTATGPNTVPGGSEELGPASWNVKEFEGRPARIQIVDHATGGWGHVNVDQIVFTDTKPSATLVLNPHREMTVERKLLCLPVKNGAKFRKVRVTVAGEIVREFPIEAADDRPDWWAVLDISAWHGKSLGVEVDRLAEDSKFLPSLDQSDEPKGQADLYREPLRQQIHFSAARGWLNDPNGLCFFDGQYHLFFQACPYTTRDSDKHWGHAVSTDLVHWKELPIALYPEALGPMWSGSAVVDWKNTSGFGADGKPPMVLAYTAGGSFVQCVAFSTDGQTFTKYEKNPVVNNIAGSNRDPKLIWYEPTQRWIMSLYVGFPDDEFRDGKRGERHAIQFLTSPDLKNWTRAGHVDGFFECPDLFPLAVDGDAKNVKWVLTAANSDYEIGQFDGNSFTSETPKLTGQRGRGFYAAQTFSDMPASDGRRIQIGWLQVPAPGMPFNQAMSVPLELRLISTPDGPRLTRWPVEELESLRTSFDRKGPSDLKVGEMPLSVAGGELLDVRAELEPIKESGNAAPSSTVIVELAVRGITLRYDAGRQELSVTNGKGIDLNVPAPLIAGRQRLAVLADRSCMEIFASDGLAYVPLASVDLPDQNARDAPVRLTVISGAVKIDSLESHRLKSMWEPGR